jgi:hypothetical protein
MALYKHFGYAGRAAEIAVYLERRMGIEQIRIGPPVLSRIAVLGVVSEDKKRGEPCTRP